MKLSTAFSICWQRLQPPAIVRAQAQAGADRSG